MRRASKVDANQAGIVRALRQVGCEVLDLHTVGAGCADLLVRDKACRLYLMEVKTAKHRRYTPQQKRFHARWPVVTVSTEAEALAVIWFHN